MSAIQQLMASYSSSAFFIATGSVGDWDGVDCSNTGATVFATTYTINTPVYTSTNSGGSWSSIAATNTGDSRYYYKVKSNGNGDGFTCGTRWFDGSDTWRGVFVRYGASQRSETFDNTGNNFAAFGMSGIYGYDFRFYDTSVLRVDTGGGVNLTTPVNLNYLYGGGVSTDGVYIVVCSIGASSNGKIRYSSNSGSSFSTLTAAGNRAFYDVKVSDDGTKILAAVSGDGIYMSTDSGATFTKKTSGTINTVKLAISSTASTIVAYANSPNRLLISKDSGATWVEKDLPTNAGDVCLSSDGSVGYVACTPASFVYKFTP